jgi:uncharacterized protein (DUF1015 family)
VATLSGFPALRYDTGRAGELRELIAPPYDVIDEDARRAYQDQSPSNVTHLTLADSPEDAARTLARWREDGILVEEPPALWWIAQDYVGPDGVARVREGIAGSIEVSRYTEGKVLPHERTHPGPKEGRLRLLRATRTQLEPIFLLYDGDPPLARPDAEPVMDVELGRERTRLWRLPVAELELAAPFLIADGHHRYETAVAFRDEEPAATRTFAVLVSSRSPGLEIFPTHRIVQEVGVDPVGLMTSTWDVSALTLYHQGNFFRLDSDDELDAREIERYAPEGVGYTPSGEEAVDAVDAGLAALAFLLRAPTVAQVFAFAHRGETMPQKTTFFYPKLPSGLLFHPV